MSRIRMSDILIIIQLMIILWPKFTRSTLLANSSFISRRNADLYSGATTDAIDRQYPTDVTFIRKDQFIYYLRKYIYV